MFLCEEAPNLTAAIEMAPCSVAGRRRRRCACFGSFGFARRALREIIVTIKGRERERKLVCLEDEMLLGNNSCVL
jgi:hypothetical protein